MAVLYRISTKNTTLRKSTCFYSNGKTTRVCRSHPIFYCQSGVIQSRLVISVGADRFVNMDLALLGDPYEGCVPCGEWQIKPRDVVQVGISAQPRGSLFGVLYSFRLKNIVSINALDAGCRRHDERRSPFRRHSGSLSAGIQMTFTKRRMSSFTSIINIVDENAPNRV